jgi:hypothetical protein
MRRITKVQVRDGYCLELTFDNGVRGIAALRDLAGKGVFALWNDRGVFELVRIGSSGELAWGDRVDLCPDSLYLRVTGKTPEDLFPSLEPPTAPIAIMAAAFVARKATGKRLR